MRIALNALLLSTLGAAGMAFGQSSTTALDGLWEFDFDILGDRNVQRLDLRIDRTKVSGRGVSGSAVAGEVDNDRITLALGAPGREFGKLSGRVLSQAGGAFILSGEGIMYGRSAKWTARRPQRPGRGAIVHEFEPTRYHRVIGNSVEPALSIHPGDSVRTKTIDANGYDHRNVAVAPGGNPVVGPFFVHGALAGDTLVVKIKRIRLTRDSAKSGSMIVGNALTSGYVQSLRAGRSFDGNWRLDHANGVAKLANPIGRLSSFEIPLRPMVGCIGVAPFKGQAISTNDSGNHGGNLDFNEIREGATVYLPVFQPGAFLYVGDGHAAQGDGELTGDALETSLELEFSVGVQQGKAIASPRVENADYLMALGVHGSLTSAMQRATAELAQWLETDFSLDPSESAAILGVAMEYQIADLVGMQMGVTARIRKSVLEKLGTGAR